MSELTKFRDHARQMAGTEHLPECVRRTAKWEAEKRIQEGWRGMAAEFYDLADPGPRPECSGCVSEADRELWTRLATEIDDYLEPQPDLFGDLSTEPAAHPTHTDTESE